MCLRIAQEHVAIRASIAEVAQAMKTRDDALADVTKAGPEVLFERLGRIVGQQGWPVGDLTPGYVLTADNLLKMAMIYTRISCGVPVIVMGETGCGKTSLIRNLSRAMGLSDLQFRVLNFHAGLGVDDIVSFVMACEQYAQEMQELARDFAVFTGQAARKIQVVAFLDEVNTCAHLALLTELICDSRIHGRPVLPGVAFVAAVNPYRLRERVLDGVGLQHANASVDPLSRLVYRVHPLPETMLTSVWDFGKLAAEDELRYLRAMMEVRVHDSPMMKAPLHVELATACLAASQNFMSQHESDCSSVSLRDPHRFKRLAVWFKTKLTEREELAREAARAHRAGGGNVAWFQSISVGLGFAAEAPTEVYSDNDIELRAIVLALAHCYRARLATSQSRRAYTTCLANTMRAFAIAHTTAWTRLHKRNYRHVDAKDVEEIIRSEQRDYLDRMVLPPGTAMNEALRENVFTLLVCILNRLPIFLVGKPGCSKSLAMKLIETHLRGPDSADPFFRKLPQFYVIGFQGSFDSTSEGVLRVFDKVPIHQAVHIFTCNKSTPNSPPPPPSCSHTHTLTHT